jgi:hypothetical protein
MKPQDFRGAVRAHDAHQKPSLLVHQQGNGRRLSYPSGMGLRWETLLVLSLLACDSPSPERVCAHAEKIAQIAGNCTQMLTRKKVNDPDEYKSVASCVMSARSEDALSKCDLPRGPGDFNASRCTCSPADPLCSCQ